MQLIGLTGGIASGKSTVSAMLRRRGVAVIDADATYHTLISPDAGRPSSLAQAIAERFEGVLHADGTVDRARLGSIVFADPESRRELEALTHPAVAAAVAAQVARLRDAGASRVVYDVPLLYERGLQESMEGVIVVWIPRALQLSRLMARDGVTREEGERRLASQMSLDAKRALATWVIDNSGPFEHTEQQVEDLYQRL